jgi:hypothetical protein
MDQYLEKKTGREEKSNEEAELIKSGQAVIYKDTGAVKIVIPKTEEAAKFYGRGTRWCTAGDNDNRFDYYNKQGPLYVIIFRGSGVKWQFHFESGQFMDEQDDDLEPSSVKPLSGLFSEDKWMAAVKNNGSAIEYIKNPSEKVQLAAVKNNGYAIRYIENPSKKVQLIAVTSHGPAIQFIKNPSENVQLAVVKNDGRMIQYIENPSEKVQLTVVKNNGRAIRYIENPSEKVQLAAVKNNRLAIQFIKNPSEKVQLAAGKIGGKIGGKYVKENKTGIFNLTPEQHKIRHRNSVLSRLRNAGKL